MNLWQIFFFSRTSSASTRADHQALYVTSMFENLKWTILSNEDNRPAWECSTKSTTTNINPASFCRFDPRTRLRSTKPVPQRNRPATCPLSVLFLYSDSLWTALPPTSYFFSLLLSSPSQSLQGYSFHNLQPVPYTCPWTSRSCTVVLLLDYFSFIVL